MSGGPGLNDKGEVIGICSMGAVRAGIQVAGFNFLIESNVASSILSEANVKSNNVLGPVDEAFIQGLTYFYAERYSAAKQKFEICTGLFDYHWRAQALIKECNAAIARGEDVALPSVSMTSSTTSTTVGQAVTFSSSVSGGKTPITYTWYLNGAAVSGATSSTWTFTPTSEGSYQVYVVVTDADGFTATSSTASLTVLPAQGLSVGGVWILVIVLVAVIAVAVAAMVMFQRRKAHPAPPAE
jgi:PKD repeat protein